MMEITDQIFQLYCSTNTPYLAFFFNELLNSDIKKKDWYVNESNLF